MCDSDEYYYHYGDAYIKLKTVTDDDTDKESNEESDTNSDDE